MTKILAEIEQTKRVDVEVDVEKHVACYPELRAAFDGSDEEFVRAGLNEMAYDILSDHTDGGLDDGVQVVDGYDGEIEVNFISVSAA